MSDDGSSTHDSLDLQAAKRELLARLLGKEGIELHDTQTIYPRQSSHKIPLSFAQQRLWFLDQLDSGKSVYNICRVYRLRGRLDIDALARSFNEIVRRHEILRTVFPTVDDQPVQSIIPNLRLTIPVLDLQKLSPAEQEAETSRLANEEVGYFFDLACGPLLRLSLMRLSTEKHVLVFAAHQIICDGWSVSLFFCELESLYRIYSGNENAALPELIIQFADYAVWQRELVKGPIIDSQLSYWKERLAGILPAFELPTDHQRPAIQTFRGARETVEITESMTNAIKGLGRNHGTTLFVTLMAVFNVLLFRYTAQQEILIGFSISNRYQAAIQNLIGFFVNTLVLRTNLSGDFTFSQLLSRVRDDCREAYAHQDLSFEKLVEELQPQRDLTRNPLFQVMFLFQNSPASDFQLPVITIEPLPVDSSISKFDLTLSLTERLQKLTGFFEYSTDLFERSTIQRMIAHFQTLLKGIVANPDQPISTLGFLTAAEMNQLIVQWNNTEADYPKESCLHELFEAQVQRTPDAIALEFDGQQHSYAKLNARANQLGRYLRGRGVGVGKLVGICAERSLEMAVGLLGILKAGGAYVPLDPSYPRERLAFMLEDAQVSILLTQAKLVEDKGWRMEDGDPPSLILDPGLQVVFVDRDWDEIAQQSDKNPLSQVYSTDLAYVIYTSGSTGQPKGVQVSHRSILNCLCAIGKNAALTAKDVFLALTTISFDIASLELFLPLITGAKLVLASRDEASDAKLLLDRLTECGATAMQATPSAWKLLLDAGWRGGEEFKIFCGGEVLSRPLANQLPESGASLWNLYGPTETTIWSMIAKVEPGESSVPIGRPIANTQIYVLDSQMQPVPLGVHGELYIGGDGLARGYLNRPELTAERFVANPFSSEPGAQLYRTGDLARYLPDGSIEFLGRVDNQIKIRGYRIELGEIETILDQHPSVKETVVVLRERDSSGDTDMVAYFVPRQDSSPSVVDLRGFLRQKVPEYMMPAIFMAIDALPLTPNGKIDRNALPPPDGERPLLDQGFVEPRTEIEELVAQVWREVLRLEKIGVYDNFFELGGHSLLATRVVARLRSNFNVDLPVRKLFELPRVAGLAQHIDFLRHNQSGVSIPPIVPVPRDRTIPLSFSQRRLWFLHKLDPNLTAYNIPATFRVTGGLSIEALDRSLREIVNRHEVLRTSIIEIGGEPIQQTIPPLTFTLPIVDLSHLLKEDAEAEIQRQSMEDARQPYNLQEAPLMRAKLLRLGEQEYVLILNFHHIVCDGSSLIIFYQELAALYETFLEGKDSNLPSLPVQYADYAAWQHERLQGEVLESQLAYWKRQLGTGLMTLNLPTDYERPVAQTYSGARLIRTLSGELTKALKELSRREGVTLFMTLLATLDILLSRHTGQEDVIVGSTIAGRNRPETDRLIGFFINALALRTNLSGNPTFLELLKRVREVCLDAYTNQDLPFERVVEEINPQRDLGRNPLFQVMFNMADTSERILALHACTVTKLSSADPSAKFDIVLHAPEVDGRIELAIVYNADLFSERRIISMLDQFTYLLSQVADHSQEGVDELSLVTPLAVSVIPDPTESLDDTWEGSIHELCAKQAERTPDFPAIIDPDKRWSYSELDRRSNRLANYLIAQGIKPKDLVAVYAQRSAALVVALLGILKAGAAFEIFDPAYPASRLISYLRLARPRAWLHIDGAGEMAEELEKFVAKLGLCCQLTILNRKLSSENDPLKAYSALDPNLSVQTDDPAYIAFTSGSTGEPKGVLSRHGPITHFLPWQRESFELVQTDRFALLSGLAYNHLHRDIFTALYLGATLYIPKPQIARSSEQLTEWLQQNEITIVHLTPALGQLLLTAGKKTLPSIRWVLFGGDVLTWRETAQIRQLAPNAKIGSFYGATETQRAVGYFQIPDEFLSNADRAVPLGQGIKDVQLLLLNKNRQLTGVGEVGELYVRSPHLATGYIGDEKRNQEIFVINPFSNDPEDRMYKTGELGRYLPDGNVEWAGRNDRRVNIRGFRVELEEVEAVLKQHVAVQNAAVVLREFELPKFETPLFLDSDNRKSKIANPKSDRCLVAYVVAEEEQQSLADLLHSYVSTRLPDYMAPSYFVVLDRLPVSPNGKVDYEALPPAERYLMEQTEVFVAPRNDLEMKLCEIFSQVLGMERVGVNDNFFRLGGHSLLAAQAAARIKETFGVGLELRTFLESPTVARLARQIGSLLSAGQTTAQSGKDEREEIEI